MTSFDDFFKIATGHQPFDFQQQFAEGISLPSLVDIQTGCGKTAMAILGWLWRRQFNKETVQSTPRRLVYCLPMRVLVEQTRDNARKWIKRLCDGGLLKERFPVYVLMGGEDEDKWETYPEREAIIIGTQDMLLSRALNRGYAASRARWPMQFGLLHTDCLWIFDEIQLMGSGLATTAQLEAFRRLLGSKDGHGCRSVWMSATMQPDWLKTVDFTTYVDDLPILNLGTKYNKDDVLNRKWIAAKPLKPADAAMGDAHALAKEVCDKHKADTRTIVVVNTVKRARQLHAEIRKRWGTADTERLVLLHSRFRMDDRKRRVDEALDDVPPGGTIVVSTQVIEAGVDVSATTLFTELAPWASLVQRFGRCNRKGEENDNAQVYWIGLPAKNANGAKAVAPPYDIDDLKASAKHLKTLSDVGLKSLPPDIELPFEHTHVIRKRDLIDLFDTTPDLAGNDIDIDRFVREVEDSDVRVFWRDYGETPNEAEDKDPEPAPRREELCAAPVGEFNKFATDLKRRGKVWRWNFLDRRWERANTNRIVPGQVYLVHSDTGGYTPDRGWDSISRQRVEPVRPPNTAKIITSDATEDDALSRTEEWQTIAQHTDAVCRKTELLLSSLQIQSSEADALRTCARWHDRGKAHAAFLAKLKPDALRSPEALRCLSDGQNTAKAPDDAWVRGKNSNPEYRRSFRHELASALAILDPRNPHIAHELRDLVAYLVAAHHGKVRLSIRSLPNEKRPSDDRRFARGVWDGDELAETDLGSGVIAPAVTLSLEPMELGLCEEEPFADQPSWAERMLTLRDHLGPFRLAYLEALSRVADWRASRE